MTLNPDIRELTTDELDGASGGFIELLIGLGLIAAGVALDSTLGTGFIGRNVLSPAVNVFDYIPHG